VSGPRLFTVPPGIAFAEGFARGFWARHGDDEPLTLARGLILVNTPRSLRLTGEALVDLGPGNALIPALGTLADLGADPIAAPDLAPAIDPLRRELRLVRLVEAYLGANARAGAAAPEAAAPALAEALAALIDECDEWGLAEDALDTATGDAHAEHWRRTLDFVDLVRRVWPGIREEEEGGALDPKARQRLAVERLIAAWATRPPAGPVIGAGSTGAVASTGRLLAAIAGLERGAVVLPGLDPDLPPPIWEEIRAGRAPEHPQAPFAGLLTALDLAPGDVAPWIEAPASPRHALITEALRPAPVTDAWQAAIPHLAPDIETAAAGLTLIEAASPRAEAAAIALAIREALEAPQTRIALVTPDAGLARRVTAELGRFDIVPDDSLGRPLAQTPPAVFLRLVLDVAGGGAAAATLLALLTHPMSHAARGRGAHLALARAYDLAALRRPLAPLAPGRLPPWPEPARVPEGGGDWLDAVEAALAPLAQALGRGAALGPLVAAHRGAAEALSRAGAEDAPAVWSGSDGAAAEALMTALAAAADAHGPEPMRTYPALLQTLLSGEEIRPDPVAPHPRVAILGPREARTQQADLVILAGLNDGVWPALPGADPWLSRPMRRRVGLPAPETRIGLAAHDFYHAALRDRVILTRAARADGAPTVPSRWLTRIGYLMGGIDGGAARDGMRARGEAILARIAHLHASPERAGPAPRPMPAPDTLARPRRLSVTEVETLIRDAYAVYARRVLGLERLDPPGRALDYRDRGMVFHAILQRFVAVTREGLPDPDAARATLLEVADAVLAETVPEADLRAIWRARLLRFADWFLEGEAGRRARAVPLALEARGSMEIGAPLGPFTLSARADRIDRRHDGMAEIYDYKSGAPPTGPQIAAGLNHQLHLQAAILAAGGFEGLDALETARGAYLGLTGSIDGGKTVAIDGLSETLSEYRAKLLSLIAAYDAGAPYVARGMPEHEGSKVPGDYDHLARRAEWEGEEE